MVGLDLAGRSACIPSGERLGAVAGDRRAGPRRTATPAARAPGRGPAGRPAGAARRTAGSGPGSGAPSRAPGPPCRRGPRPGPGPGAPRPGRGRAGATRTEEDDERRHHEERAADRTQETDAVRCRGPSDEQGQTRRGGPRRGRAAAPGPAVGAPSGSPSRMTGSSDLAEPGPLLGVAVAPDRARGRRRRRRTATRTRSRSRRAAPRTRPAVATSAGRKASESTIPRRSEEARATMLVSLALHREDQPQREVGGGPEPAAEGEQHEGDPDQGDVDPAAIGEPTGHAAEDPVVAAGAGAARGRTGGTALGPRAGDGRASRPTSRSAHPSRCPAGRRPGSTRPARRRATGRTGLGLGGGGVRESTGSGMPSMIAPPGPGVTIRGFPEAGSGSQGAGSGPFPIAGPAVGRIIDAMEPITPGPTRAEPARCADRAGARMLAGVAGGLADYFDFDVAIVRVGLVALAVMGGSASRCTWRPGCSCPRRAPTRPSPTSSSTAPSGRIATPAPEPTSEPSTDGTHDRQKEGAMASYGPWYPTGSSRSSAEPRACGSATPSATRWPTPCPSTTPTADSTPTS